MIKIRRSFITPYGSGTACITAPDETGPFRYKSLEDVTVTRIETTVDTQMAYDRAAAITSMFLFLRVILFLKGSMQRMELLDYTLQLALPPIFVLCERGSSCARRSGSYCCGCLAVVMCCALL